jgi:hypothetical protein
MISSTIIEKSYLNGEHEHDTLGTYKYVVLEGNVGAWHPWYHSLEEL